MGVLDVPRTPPPDGARQPVRVEGAAKLTGSVRFTADLVVPGAWEGATLRSTEPHARLLGIDRDPAFDWSRVVLVTAADIPGENVIAALADDQPALAADEIRHVAEPIALVAAPTRTLARAALAALHPRTEPLPTILDPATAPESCRTIDIVKGDVDAAMAAADLVVEHTYRTGYQEHLYLEPQAMVAIPTGNGVRVRGSMQCPYSVHGAVTRALGLPRDAVVIEVEEVGGGFGGKEDFPSVIGTHAALLARAAGRPVRIVYDRHEDLAASTKRHPSISRHRTGFTREGVLVAQDIELVLDAGAYTTVSGVVLARGAIHAAGPYRCPNVRIHARAALTNTPPNGAFRGFGGPQSQFAAESQMNRAAEDLGIPPDALRRRNAYRTGDTSATGQLLDEGVSALDVLDAAVAAAGPWPAVQVLAVPGLADGTFADPARHGRGLAMGWHGVGFTGLGEAQIGSRGTVDLTADGQIVVRVASVEMGQGARTVLAQIAAETLGVDPGEVEVPRPSTDVVPDSGPTVASRTTMIAGDLVARAAAHLRGDVEARTSEPFASSYRRHAADVGPASATVGHEMRPGFAFDDETCQGDAYPAYGWSCAIAEASVDTDTGEVRVQRVVQAVEAGRIVNRVLAEGQVEGGTLQAVGWATIEALDAPDGRYRQDRLATYLVPTALDAPRIETVLVERPDPRVPHGAKGLGELPMDIPAPAITAAIHAATGAWIDQVPATPGLVLAAIEAQEGRP